MGAGNTEKDLDETIEESFPASDPPANTVELGIHVHPVAPTDAIVVTDNAASSRFEATVDGHVAYLQYERRPDAFVLVHTEVPEALGGRGIGRRLAEFGLHVAEGTGLPVVVLCRFVRDYMKRHNRQVRAPRQV